MEFFITFLEGLISFISPCMLPLLPVYISYFAGGGEVNLADKKAKTLSRCFGFILGFSVIFCSFGMLAGFIGGVFGRYRDILTIICGVLIILFGFAYIGIVKLNFLKGVKDTRKITSFSSAFLFGIIYSVSLTPCVGAMLGSALSLAAASQTHFKGFLLLLSYCVGLGIPFLISAIMIDKLKSLFLKIKKHYNVLNIVCGAILIVVGTILIFQSAVSFAATRKINKQSNENNIESPNSEDFEITITNSNFKEMVIDNVKPVLLDFWASWCPPCRMLSPNIASIAREYKNVLVVGKVNVDEEQKLARTFGISSIPMLMLFRDGKIVKTHLGYMDKDTIIKEFELDTL